eukprot:TRINITY_DN16631_c0_g1_i2.p1 TRINITY_DN16631_c0_g1~~TRINITY_DN16631_c0_g1_i2.p1  ORF type:complete len:137 (+),score=39.77 TRINITY_DN16631_c0_g1_i2:199-609(+)
METETIVLDSKLKARLQPEVRRHRIDFDSLKRQALSAHEDAKYKEQKDFLLGVNVEDEAVTGKHQDVLRKQNAALEGALRVAYETSSVANSIERDLRDQNIRARETQKKVKELDGTIDESGSIVTRMLKREQCTMF